LMSCSSGAESSNNAKRVRSNSGKTNP
jgi:hypothetical protein